MPHSNADIVIVGGGPGGSAAAIQCASVGLNVTLIEREEFPRDRPGETLHPGVEPLLKQLGVYEEVAAAGFLRHEGNWVRWGGPARFEGFGADDDGPWRGYQAWRAEFDLILINRARALGVNVVQPCSARGLLLEQDVVRGVRTSDGDIPSSFVVDATGDRHWLARQLNLEIERWSPSLVARYGYFEGDCPERDHAPSIISDTRAWDWTARVSPGIYQWSHLCFDDPLSESAEPPQELIGLNELRPMRGADVSWRMVRKPAGSGYFLIGDAAGVLDPTSSHGVLRAIMSGMMAAHLAVKVKLQHTSLEHAVQAYCHWLVDWFVTDAVRMCEMYARLPAPPPWLAETERLLRTNFKLNAA